MKNKTIFFATLLASLGFNSVAQTTQKFSATKANDYGIVYTLPKTLLDITVETETTVKTPGEYYKYAKRYLNIDNPIATPSRSVTVKSVTVVPRGIADPDRRYVVQFKPGSQVYMTINSENLPVSVNTEKSFGGNQIELPVAVAAEPTPLETPAARQVINEEMLQSQSTAKRAELAAAQIYALRQSRTDLITGQSDAMPPDGKAMQIVMDNIAAQEAALVAMFAGTTQTSTDVATITYEPSEEVNEQIIARISATDGLVDSDDLSGAPLYLTLNITERGKMPVNEKGIELPFPKNGFAYCIPGKADVDISFDNEKVADTTVDIAQFGIVYGLNPNSFTDKKEPIYLIFDPATGAASEIGMANK